MSQLDKIDVGVLLLLEGGDITWRVVNDTYDNTFKVEGGKYYFLIYDTKEWHRLYASGINSLHEFLSFYIGKHNFDSFYLVIEDDSDET